MGSFSFKIDFSLLETELAGNRKYTYFQWSTVLDMLLYVHGKQVRSCTYGQFHLKRVIFTAKKNCSKCILHKLLKVMWSEKIYTPGVRCSI